MLTDREQEVFRRMSRDHRPLLDHAKLCGCFYCLANFMSLEIREYIDEGETALCPRCGIDAVMPMALVSIGTGVHHTAARETLEAMRAYWFGGMH